MSTERKGLLKFQDRDVTIAGDDLKVGDKVPDFIVHTMDWKLLRGIGDTQGKVRIIGSLPSLNTQFVTAKRVGLTKKPAD